MRGFLEMGLDLRRVGAVGRAVLATGMGWPTQRSKGGGTRHRRGPGDMSGVGHPVSVARPNLIGT